MDPKSIVEQIAEENRAYFTSEQGQGALSLLRHASEARWAYLPELLQNAIDAQATRICVRAGRACITVQHNGSEPLSERTVRALSRIGGSTKGLDTVGFMGVGFKSVFRRATRVRVAGFGWAFRYETSVEEGTLGERYFDQIGAVCPSWDDSAPQPDEGYTTRFTLEVPLDDTPFEADVQMVFGGEPAIYGVLRRRGVLEIEVADCRWLLSWGGEPPGALVTARADNGEQLTWRAFAVTYKPNAAAVRRLIESRGSYGRRTDAAGYAAALRVREILGLVPVNAQGELVPISTGRVFATMPTGDTWPVGMHLQADWSLSITRAGLPQLEENEWQDDIVRALPALIAQYLTWAAERVGAGTVGSRALHLMRAPSADSASPLERVMASQGWRDALSAQIEHIPFVPAYEGESLRMLTPRTVRVVPRPWRELSQRPELRPDLLFGHPIASLELLGEGMADLLYRLGHLGVLAPADLEGASADRRVAWLRTDSIAEDEKVTAVMALWSALPALTKENRAWSQAAVVPTDIGTWTRSDSVVNLPRELELSEDSSEATRVVVGRVAAQLPEAASRVWTPLRRHFRATTRELGEQMRRRAAADWLAANSRALGIPALIHAVTARELESEARDLDWFVRLGEWVREHGLSKELVGHVLSEHGTVLPVDEALVAEPYHAASEQRRALFPEVSAISSRYVDEDDARGTAAQWAAFFEEAGAKGPIRIAQSARHGLGKQSAAEAAGLTPDDLPEANYHGYTVTDYVLAPPLTPERAAAFADLLDTDPGPLRERFRRLITWSYYGSHRKVGGPSTAADHLRSIAWVATTLGLRRPADALASHDPARPDAPVSRLKHTTVRVLEEGGVIFGTDVPQVPALVRLAASSSSLTGDQIAELLDEALDVARDTHAMLELARVVQSITVPAGEGLVPWSRVVERVGSNARSGLGGWVVGLEQVAPRLRDVMRRIPSDLRPPETTTGAQALSYLEMEWEASRHDPDRATDGERLAQAYSYVLEDTREDEALRARWIGAKRDAWVQCDARDEGAIWLPVTGPRQCLFDDAPEEGLAELVNGTDALVRAAHLGRDLNWRTEVAQELGLVSLSAALRPHWDPVVERHAPHFTERYATIFAIVARAAGTDMGSLALRPVWGLTAQIRGQTVQRTTRVAGESLYVAGDPDEFAREVAAITVSRIGSRAIQFGIELALLIREMDDAERWERLLRQFAQRHGVDSAIGAAADDIDRSTLGGGLPSRGAARGAVEGAPPSPLILEVRTPWGGEPPGELDQEVLTSPAVGSVPGAARQSTGNAHDTDDPASGAGGVTPSPAEQRRDFLSRSGRSMRSAQQSRQIVPRYSPDMAHEAISAAQQDRGRLGEEEFARRAALADGLGGIRIVADRRLEPCGYDFECTWEGMPAYVEVKTFTPEGRMVLPQREVEVGKELGDAFLLVCLLDDGGEPSGWQPLLLRNPVPKLETLGTWRVRRSLEVSVGDLRASSELRSLD